MAPRRANTAAGGRAAQDAAGDEAGPSDRVPEYVTFSLIQAIMGEGYKQEQEVKVRLAGLAGASTSCVCAGVCVWGGGAQRHG